MVVVRRETCGYILKVGWILLSNDFKKDYKR